MAGILWFYFHAILGAMTCRWRALRTFTKLSDTSSQFDFCISNVIFKSFLRKLIFE